MLTILSLWRNRWLPSEFSPLPAADAVDPERADYLLLAHTLARLLARCTPRGAQRDFAASVHGYRTIKAALRAGRVPRLPAQLLSDLSHEIAMHADRPTRDAARRCLLRSGGAGPQSAVRFASAPR